MNNNGVNIREIVTEILLSIDKGEEQSHILLKNVLDKYDYLPKQDKNFIKRTVTGTLENRIKIDYIIDSFSKTPVKKMKPIIRNIMRMSVYQIVYMDKVPDSAVCNEAVKLAGKRGFKGLKGFVNGVLRNISRDYQKLNIVAESDIEKLLTKDELTIEEKEELILNMGMAFSCPKIILNSLVEDYGLKESYYMLKASLKERGISIRVNEDLSEKELIKIKEEWDREGISYEENDKLKYAYILKKADRLSKLEGFLEGKYTVQDFSSMNVCELADIKGGEFILDVCGAPGGKSLHASNKLRLKELNFDEEKKGHVLCRDLTAFKVDIIDENIKRMKCNNVKAELFDARVYDENMAKAADIVLLDVPCSGFGVISKKPDIKYNVSEKSLEDIVILQREIIDNAVRYVKDDGILMFSTCTLRKAENDSNVDYILSKGDFELIEKKLYFISEKWDGFFIAKFKKI